MKEEVYSWHRHGRLGIGLLALLGLSLGLWASLSRIEGAVIASAVIEPLGGRVVLQHAQGGKLIKINVKEGDRLQKGQVLALLDQSRLQQELGAIETRLAALGAQKERALAEKDQKPDEFSINDNGLEGQLHQARQSIQAQEHLQLRQQAAQIMVQIEGIDAQSDALEHQRQLIETERQNHQNLYKKGLSQISPLLALQREEARLLGHKGELAANRAAALEKRAQIDSHLNSLIAQRKQAALSEILKIEAEQLDLELRKTLLIQQIDDTAITSPVDGTIFKLSPNSVLQPYEVFAEINPAHSPLIAKAQIPPHHIDEVRLNAPVQIVFTAFNSRLTPHFSGNVVKISADTHQLPNLPPAYHIEISLPQTELSQEGVNILAGMGAEVFIKTQARSPLQWLWQPFGDYFRRAMRES